MTCAILVFQVNETDGKPIYEIRHAAVLEDVLAPFEEFEDSYFNVTTGINTFPIIIPAFPDNTLHTLITISIF